MTLLDLIITAIALSMDAFAVSISKGLSGRKYRLKNSLLEAGKVHRLDTTKMLEKASAMSDTVVKRVIDDYEKERIAYSIVSASCENALQELLNRHKALFEIDIVTFSPDKFYGYVTLKDKTNVYTSYPTTVETIYEDTATALNQLK